MASKNPKAPARTRAPKSVAPVATPRRRRPAAKPMSLASDAAGKDGARDAPARHQTDSAEHIRMRAYFLHLERRGRPGNPVEDWLIAEREVRGGDTHEA